VSDLINGFGFTHSRNSPGAYVDLGWFSSHFVKADNPHLVPVALPMPDIVASTIHFICIPTAGTRVNNTTVAPV